MPENNLINKMVVSALCFSFITIFPAYFCVFANFWRVLFRGYITLIIKNIQFGQQEQQHQFLQGFFSVFRYIIQI